MTSLLHSRFICRAIPLLLALGWLAVGPVPLDAQYFGRNKVQYETFDFRVLKTEHFDVYFYPEEEAAARDAARMAERWYARYTRLLDYELSQRQPLVLYGSHPAFQQTTTVGGAISPGTGGVTESAKQRIVMPLTGSYQETDHVVGHELVHAFQYDISGLGRSGGGISAGARQLGTAPLWFIEGMAEYLSGGPVDANAALVVRDAALTGDIPSIEQLTRDPRFFPYTWGHAFWAYVGGRWGDAVIGQILRLVGEGVPYDQAFERLLNVPLDVIGEDWAVTIRRAYLPLLTERREAREIAEPLITEAGEGGRINIGPSVSPDGRYVAFLSSLSDLDIEVFLADAETGEVIRRLVRGAAFDSHFQSLSYVNSAGTWSPDGERFAFAALSGGHDIIVILDVQSADIVREIEIPDVSEITTPTWSPDGATLVFSGIEGGTSDLYAYDLQTEQTRRLTEDPFAQLHPNFSPDGTQIAFATDRGPDNDLATLSFSGYRLAVRDLSTGQTRILPRTEGGANNINPVWTPEGDGLYFISYRSGIPNLYRLDLNTTELFRLTDLFGGISGITSISPAISAARSADRLLFTAYEENGYNIYALNTAEELTGTLVPPAAQLAEEVRLPATLPPVPRPAEPPFTRVATYLENPTFGLPAPMTMAAQEIVPYGPSLSLDYLGQPQVGYATGGAIGQGGLYGGISALFSDMLGYHTVFGVVQASGRIDELGFSTTYLNRKRRWNWGALAQRIPYISVGQQFVCGAEGGSCPASGATDAEYQLLRFRTFNSNLMALAQYPFSQARRVEFSAGYRRIARDVQVTAVPGRALIQNGRVVQFQQTEEARRDELDGFAEAYNLFETSAALVYDNSLFGYTSPFAGQRYRFEVTPTFGSLQFVQALADYRRYLWFRPFTVAVQGVHFGRYGRDSDGIFFPLFLGQPSFVRGYGNVYSDCRGNPGGCERDVLEQLFGSRIAVTKAELRFPLIRQLVIGPIPFPPIEGFIFGDAGVTWGVDFEGQETEPVFRRGIQADPSQRGILTSAGVGARINLFGYAIAEVNYVRPFALEGWHWQFALQPGF